MLERRVGHELDTIIGEGERPQLTQTGEGPRVDEPKPELEPLWLRDILTPRAELDVVNFLAEQVAYNNSNVVANSTRGHTRRGKAV